MWLLKCCDILSLGTQLVEDLPGVSLALSLHAPNQELRQSIVPSARAYKLDKLMAAIDTYREKTGQKVCAPSMLTFVALVLDTA